MKKIIALIMLASLNVAHAGTITTFPITTLPMPFFNAQSYGWLPDGTDRSTQALALLAAVCPAGVGGGTIYFPPSTTAYRADSQLFFPNTGGASPVGCNIRLTGGGGGPAFEMGSGLANSIKGATVLDLRYQGNNNGKIETEGMGTLSIDNLTFIDGSTSPTYAVGSGLTNIVVTGGSAVATFSATQTTGSYLGATWLVRGSGTTALNGLVTVTARAATTITFTTTAANGTYTDATMDYNAPFIHTTNTVLRIRDNAFIGNSGHTSTSQDAIVLGGIIEANNGDQGDSFFGYGTVIESNSFAFINRALFIRTDGNDITFMNNTFVRHGNGIVGVECNGLQSNSTGNTNFGIRVLNNLFEIDSYNPAVKLTDCDSSTFIGNSFWDGAGVIYSLTSAFNNVFSFNFVQGGATLFSDNDSGFTTSENIVLNAQGQQLRTPVLQTALIYSAAGKALPTCNAAAEGSRASVKDATSPTYNSTYTSGGAVHVGVYCNGTNWVTQ